MAEKASSQGFKDLQSFEFQLTEAAKMLGGDKVAVVTADGPDGAVELHILSGGEGIQVENSQPGDALRNGHISTAIAGFVQGRLKKLGVEPAPTLKPGSNQVDAVLVFASADALQEAVTCLVSEKAEGRQKTDARQH